jgi:sRNA-binding regulator protein Hfq
MNMSAMSSSDRPVPVLQHVAEMVRYRDEKRLLSFALANGTTIEGTIEWFDDQAVHVKSPATGSLTLFKHAVLFYRALD